MTTLVTGASGFVGSWLVHRLAQDGVAVAAQMRRPPSGLFAALGLDSDPRVTLHVDEDAAGVLAAVAPDELFHLAGKSQVGELMKAPATAMEANAREGWLLFEALRGLARPPRTVVASTDAIYGETGARAATEDDPPRATGPYEVSKLMLDAAARCYASVFGLPIAVARLGNVYGPGDANTARIVPSVLSAIRGGGVPHLRGGGRAVRSLLHVDDCIAGLRLLAAHAGDDGVRGQAFNLSGSAPMTTHEIARTVLDAFGLTEAQPEITEGAPGETSVKYSSSLRLEQTLGWSPRLSLADGIATIVESEVQGA
ncbi:MAG: NAD-dependent epimerase/dehydratase family protein [Deinococcus-Thermus bacterium]|jgi:nucleoside-diphosphate-sugar epimerase|nr:NAD-dependent epimerase/dehydratase family protein [Deinococcota bacterium]